MPALNFSYTIDLPRDKKRDCPAKLELFWELILKVRLYFLEGSDIEADARNVEKLNSVNKSTRIIHHNQLLMTKFGKILYLTRK